MAKHLAFFRTVPPELLLQIGYDAAANVTGDEARNKLLYDDEHEKKNLAGFIGPVEQLERCLRRYGIACGGVIKK